MLTRCTHKDFFTYLEITPKSGHRYHDVLPYIIFQNICDKDIFSEKHCKQHCDQMLTFCTKDKSIFFSLSLSRKLAQANSKCWTTCSNICQRRKKQRLTQITSQTSAVCRRKVKKNNNSGGSLQIDLEIRFLLKTIRETEVVIIFHACCVCQS